jgi:hypothetical protein
MRWVLPGAQRLTVTIDAFCVICGGGIVWYDGAGWIHTTPPVEPHRAEPKGITPRPEGRAR